MITPDLSTAAHFADRIAVMYLGRIVEYGPARQVINDPQHPYTKALLSVVPDRDPRRRKTAQILSGETPNPVAIPSGCRFRPRCPIAQDPCTEVDPQLELARGAHPDPTKLPASLPKPKLRLAGVADPALVWDFAIVKVRRSGYLRARGMAAPMSWKASRWVLVGSARIGTVAVVPAKRT